MSSITTAPITTAPIPAGWYPDPHGNPQQRWWDGDAWTSDVAPYEVPHQQPASRDDSNQVAVSTGFPAYNAVSAHGAVQAYPAASSSTTTASFSYDIDADSAVKADYGTVVYKPMAMVPMMPG